MVKVAVMTDSNSGITQAEAKELGIRVIPMPFNIDGEEYLEDINLTQEEFYEKLQGGAKVSTSQPSIGYVNSIWDELLEEYDEIVYIPMSSGLSGSCSTAKMLAEDYDGKVQVVNNQRISVTMRSSVYDAQNLAKQGKSAKEICEILEREALSSSIYITVDTLKYLKKGGRLTPAVAAIGTLLKIKPVLQIQGEKLDSFAKARNMKAARQIMIDAMKEDFEKRFGGIDKHQVTLCIAYTKDRALAEDFKKEVEPHFPGYDIHIDPLSLSVSCHIGPGSLALACSQYVPELQ